MKLSEVVSQYIGHKRSLGMRFHAEEFILKAFAKSLDDPMITSIEAASVLAFLNGIGPVTDTWVKKYHVLSGFYRFALARRMVVRSPLPPSIPRRDVPAFVPYIYSQLELKQLLDATPGACGSRVPLDDYVLHALILLLYGAGLRIGESLHLTVGDVDLGQACLLIRETKFYKTRFVPLGKDLTKVLVDYSGKRNASYSVEAQAPFFCQRDGQPVSQSIARSAFRRMRTAAGVVRDGGARNQPRIHDLRHSAAVHRLIAWYRNGVDLHDLLPKLATYLGHVNLAATQRYLTMTPELLYEASRRFEHYALEAHHE